MRYAMTGATGFVGGALARQLREAGHEVVALVRDPSRATALSELGVELRPGDLDSTAALDALTADVDGLFHVAGWYRLGERDGSVGDRVNVQGTRNVLLAALQNRVRRVVYTSTVAVNSDTQEQVVDETYRFNGTHLSNYDRTKAAAHDVALELAREGLPVVVVQPGLVYGPGDTAQTGDIIAQVVRGKRPPVPSAGGVCWAHVDDVARGHVLAMERGEPGQSYMLTGPHLRLADGLKQVAAIAGTKGPLVLPEAAVRGTAAVLGAIGTVVPLPPGYAAETMRASLATYYGTSAKAQAELGWQPRPLEQGLRETVDAVRRS